MSFTSNFTRQGCRFDSGSNSEDNASPVDHRQLVIDMLDTPRRSERLLQQHLEEHIGITTERPRPRIFLSSEKVSAASAALDSPGRVLRSGTVLPPSHSAARKRTALRSEEDGRLAVARSTVAAASANPLQSTIAESEDEDDDEDDEVEITLTDGKDQDSEDGKNLASIPEEGKESSSSGDEQEDYVPTDVEVGTEEFQPEVRNEAQEDDEGGEVPKEGPRKKKRKNYRKNKTEQTRDRNIWRDLQFPWSNAQGKSAFLDHELEDQLWCIAKTEFAGTPANRLKWMKEAPTDRESHNITRRVHKCHFYWESKCPFKLLVERNNTTNLSMIYIGNRAHSDHNVCLKSRGGSSAVIAAVVSSPTTLRKKGSKTLVKSVMYEKKLVLDPEEQRKTARKIARLQRALEKDILCGLDGRTYEGLDKKLQSYDRETLEMDEGFDENTYFRCGDYICDGADGVEADQRVCVLFSTGNCLMNCYRQQCTGVDFMLAVDTSYRYTVQGYGLMPIKAVDFSQTGHTVGYGLVSKEDTSAHNFLLYQLKAECERTIKHYRDEGYFD